MCFCGAAYATTSSERPAASSIYALDVGEGGRYLGIPQTGAFQHAPALPKGPGGRHPADPYTEIVTPPPRPPIELMHPTLIDQPFHREGMVYEEKVDGFRMLAYSIGDTVALISRNGRDHTKRFPGIAAAIRSFGKAMILDGEVAIFDKHLLSRFEWLRHRMPPDLATPPIFVAFDCLRTGRKDLRSLPLCRRRHLLEELVEGQDLVLLVRRARR
jgi:ATP-dependent DNA ligase